VPRALRRTQELSRRRAATNRLHVPLPDIRSRLSGIGQFIGRLLSIAVTAVPARKTATDRVVAYWLIATAVMILLMS